MNLSWTFSIGFLAAAPLVGRVLDAGLHRSHIPKLRDVLFSYAIRFDEISYIKIVHRDAQHAETLLGRVFGRGTLSLRLVLVSLIPTAFFFLLLHQDEDGLDLVTPLLILSLANVFSDQLSLIFTRKILVKISHSAKSLVLWLLFDILLWLTLAQAPCFVVAVSTNTLAVMGPFEFYGNITHLITSSFEQPSGGGDIVGSVVAGLSHIYSLLLFLVFLTAALPSTVHIALLLRDLVAKLVLAPAASFASQFLEYISEQAAPMTWICTTLGMFPVFFKAMGFL